MQLHFSALQPGHRQQVFHQTDEPHSIVINIGVDLLLGLLVNGSAVGHEVAGIAGNGGQGGAQIVGDGAQQVCPELLALGQEGGLLFFPGNPFVVHGQGAFAKHRQYHAAFEALEGVSRSPDGNGTVDPVPGTDGKTDGVGGLLPGAPYEDRAQRGAVFLRNGPGSSLPLGPEQPAVFRTAACRTDPHRAVQEPGKLPADARKNVRLGGGFLQKLAGLKQHLTAESGAGGFPGVVPELARQGPGEHGGEKHDGKGDRVALVVDPEGKPGIGKQVVENENADDGGNQAAHPAACHHGGDEHRQKIGGDDIGLGKAQTVEQPPDKCGKQQDQERFGKIPHRQGQSPGGAVRGRIVTVCFSVHSGAPFRGKLFHVPDSGIFQ